MAKETKIAVLSSHADDLEFSMGGTLAKRAKSDAVIHQFILTDSNGQGLEQQRKQEAIAGMAALGLGSMIFFVGSENKFKDGTLRYYKTRSLAKAVGPYFQIAEQKGAPYTELYTMGEKGYTGHPDHKKVNRLAWLLFRYITTLTLLHQVDMSAQEKQLWDIDYAPAGGYFVKIPLVDTSEHTAVDISDTFEMKITAIGVHKSQLGNGGEMHIKRLAKLPKKEYFNIINRQAF